MKHIRKPIVGLTLCLILFLVIYNAFYYQGLHKTHETRNVIINRINRAVAIAYEKGEEIQPAQLIRECTSAELERDSVPDKFAFYPLEKIGEPLELSTDNNAYSGACNEQCMVSIYGEKGALLGVAHYIYVDVTEKKYNIMVNTMALTCFLVILFTLLWVNQKILRPFQTFSEYPVKLAKGRLQDKLPENKNRYFGQYIWGMNMLVDVLDGKQKKMQKMEYDRQTMLTSIAHGVKTPVTNIKLYADAIQFGLYQENGQPNASDAEIAGKIEKNAMDIEKMVTELIHVSSSTLCDYEPKKETFYMKELAVEIEQEYEKRFKLNHMKYSITCMKNPTVNSDKQGILTMLTQLIENAIKYGDGKSLSINFDKQEDGYYFSVKNTGSLLADHELPFVFKSFWRGSNANDREGSGVGLFVVKDMAQKLGGDVFAKCWRETGEMEFVIYLNA